MIIKNYSCKRFAGIKDKNIEFAKGLNVLLGDNESGKSTLIEGIYSVMFKSAKVGRRSTEDKNFNYKFMPLPNGDSIDGKLIISNNSGDYILRKEWGVNPSAQLTTPKSEEIKGEDKINEILKDIFIFKEATFSNLLFARQNHFREALEGIIGNQETTGEISTLFRKAVMELDGVSIDDLGLKIDSEINSLLKRWDVEKEYPENNRGINNPYISGIGEVVECFYKKENIRLTMSEAKAKEEHFELISAQLKDLEEKLAAQKDKIKKMEEIEADVIKRSILEPRVDLYDKEQESLRKISKEWPVHEFRLEQLAKEIDNINNEQEKLEIEKEQAGKVKEKENLLKILDKIDKLKKSIQETESQISKIKNVTREDIQKLDSCQQEVLQAEAKMKAGVMIGKLNYYSGTTDLIIIKDLDEPMTINAGDTFQANGFIKLQADELLEIELKSGDIDFAELRRQFMHFKKEQESLLLAVNANSIEEAKLNKEKLDDLNKDLLNYNKQINELLGDDSYEILNEKIQAYGDLSQVRSIEAIETELKNINTKQVELFSEQKTLEGIIAKWLAEFTSFDELYNKTSEIIKKQKEDKEQLEKLAPLPQEYESTDAFRNELTKIRNEYETGRSNISDLKEECYVSEQNLPELTYEEFAAEFEAADELFNRKLERSKKLLKIKAAFESTRAEIDKSSFVPLAEAFSKNVILLTDDNFIAGEIDNSFKLRLAKDTQTDIPVDLLSTGTYDSVALALRLAILEYLLADKEGFVILDDCLVDLDPCRKERAAQLIKEFAEKHQVIFTTCSPETADLLGGKTILM